ncbi:uncharacterized protein BX663DRAFT_515036 [Cokeromyces recurvatus]|uniref:uncharacterized protein n=1 Tax=Cokeromyces recurvatus TaxID=90255 RepID=UPI00221EECE0|nr:uncharacterized protein BX663DRAFT_515036 [Cokeromyces recurvatus]KAI7901127.1 hypothetical protein BX663DRAFT_515036 [Cokeromyces recurvatus]
MTSLTPTSSTAFKRSIPPPPPPPSSNLNKSLAPPSSDFRTAVIKNHWNDPPKKIFHQITDETHHDLNKQEISIILSNKIELCKTAFENGPQKRIVDDTIRRIDNLLKELEDDQLTKQVSQLLYTLSKALESSEYTKALEIHTKLMTAHYENHGSWILGLKRLIDLTEKASK